MMERQLEYIHYWKGFISDIELQKWLDKMSMYDRDTWIILLEEKLRRVESEIYILELK